MTQRGDGDAAAEIDVFIPVKVPEPGALATGENDFLGLVIRHKVLQTIVRQGFALQ